MEKTAYIEEVHNLYSSPSIIRMIKSRRMGCARHAARTGAKRNEYKVLVGKPEEYSPLGIRRRRWVDNIKMDLTELRRCGVGWTSLA
jgi:hypothetical protein